jgi:arginase family enzyme
MVNVGHRDLFLVRDEIAEFFEAAYSATDVAVDADRISRELRSRCEGATQVWLDVDADVFDPAAVPAVHQPLPFGLAPAAFLKLLDAAWTRNVVGLSISEFDPGRDVRETALQFLGWLVEFVLLRVHEEIR